MRNRSLWVGAIVICVLLIAGWLVLRSMRDEASPADPDGAGRSSAGGPAPVAPSLPVATGTTAAGTAGFDCARPSGEAVRIDGTGIPLERLCANLARLGAVTKAGVDRRQARLALDRIVDASLVQRALAQQHLVVSDAEVAAALEPLQPRGGSPTADTAVLKEQLHERLELEKLVAMRSKGEVTEQDIDAELANGAPGIDRGQGVRVEAWIARVPPGAGPERDATARKAAEGFAVAVKNTAAEAAAAQHSVTAMPAFVLSEAGIEPELEKAALSVGKGQWTGAVKTRVGWTVLRVLETVEGMRLDDQALRQRVRQALVTRRLQAAKQRVLEELRGTANIEVLVDL